MTNLTPTQQAQAHIASGRWTIEQIHCTCGIDIGLADGTITVEPPYHDDPPMLIVRTTRPDLDDTASDNIIYTVDEYGDPDIMCIDTALAEALTSLYPISHKSVEGDYHGHTYDQLVELITDYLDDHDTYHPIINTNHQDPIQVSILLDDTIPLPQSYSYLPNHIMAKCLADPNTKYLPNPIITVASILAPSPEYKTKKFKTLAKIPLACNHHWSPTTTQANLRKMHSASPPDDTPPS
jgi:hypothetical protein